MKKRAFLQAVAGGTLGLALPSAFAAKEKPPTVHVAPTLAQVLEGVDSAGNRVSLDDFAGKTTLVSFFTFECVPCHEDLRLMREFFQANKAKNFAMLGVNMDKSKDVFLDYIRLIGQAIPSEQRFPIVWRAAPGHRDSFGTIIKKPSHFLLNKALKVVLRREGRFESTDWDDLWTKLG